MDVALAESYGWVKWWPFKTVSRKKKSKPKPKAKSRKGKEKAGEEDEDVEEEEEEKKELWCIWASAAPPFHPGIEGLHEDHMHLGPCDGNA